MLKRIKLFGSPKKDMQEGPILWGPGSEQVVEKAEAKSTYLYNIPVCPEAFSGNGMIWTVQSPEGGDGATTVATNLAALLAIGSPEKVVLIDLDGIGAVRSRMGLKESLENILDWQDVTDVGHMQRAMVNHTSGVMVVPGVVHYDHLSLITPGLIFNILSILKERFEHIILDCPPVGMQNNTWAAALVSNIIITVIKPERTSLDFTHDNLVFLKRLGCEERSCIILNQTGIPGGIRTADLINNKSLGLIINHALPYSIAVSEANNRRELVVIEKPKDEFSVALRKLVENMEGR